MPEGDTIYRAAARLRRVLDGRVLDDASVDERYVDPRRLDGAPVAGRTVTRIETRGKHLLIHLDDERVLHTHLGMTGTWDIYAADDRWRKPSRQAALRLATGDRVAVCFSPKTLEVLTATGLRRHRWISRLGPDILTDPFDEDEALERLRRHRSVAIGVAMLDQSLVCGIGNVYKSEALFVTGMHPFDLVGAFDEETLRALVQKTRALMRRNLEGYPRKTRFSRDGSRAHVYGRSGEPCHRCGTRIDMRRQGDLGRSTYWCPRCQPPAASD